MNPAFEVLADGLAGPGYAVLDEFLSNAEVESILSLDEFKHGLLQFQKAGIGHNHKKAINEQIRGDYVYWLDRHTSSGALETYFHRMDQLIAFVNRSLFLSLKDIEAHLTIYPAGSYYKRHLDQFKSNDHRKLSVIVYLNKGWSLDDGGQLRLYEQTGYRDVIPEAGRLVCFRSDALEHEVLPARRDRLSITGWILDQLVELKHL